MTHLCFGYAYVVTDKPSGYSFLPELDKCSATAIPIEAAQPQLDPVILEKLPGNKVMLCVIDLGGQTIETAELVTERLHGALVISAPIV